MSVIHVTRESHNDPFRFRIKYEDAKSVLGPDSSIKVDKSLPILESSSKVSIIGGGFSGIGAAMTCLNKLKEEDFVVFEKHDNFGGTWYANTYPGAASDIPAALYSFSNELNDNWSNVQPPQYEMEEYILSIVEKYKLHERAKFRTAVSTAIWMEETGMWELSAVNLNNGQVLKHSCRVLVCCPGGLVQPNKFSVPGLEDFKGEYMHSAIWNHDVSFKGKKVVVVGNGCSANQVIPALLDKYEVESITQMVRSKHYLMPPIPAALHFFYKLLSFSRIGLLIVRWVIALVAESRFPLFKGDGLISRCVRWYNTRKSRKYMKSMCPKEYQSKLIPDYKIGCKRMIYDNNYLPCLHDPRIDIVDDPMDHITSNGIKLKNGDFIEADIIVGCIGYDLEKNMGGINIIGRNDLNVSKLWKEEGISTYETYLLRDCPNLFFIAGPNSATGHHSVVLASENGCNYFSKVAPKILSGTYKSICVKTSKYYEWFNAIQKELKSAVFGTAFGGCVSWYTNQKVNYTVYPYSQITYWWRSSHPKWADFEIETFETSNIKSKKRS